MRLAVALGWQSVELMLDSLSYRELMGWLYFFSNEPLPEDRADLRMSALMTLIANVNREKGKPPMKIDDFKFDFWKDHKTDVAKDFIDTATLINAAFGGKIVSRNE